MSQPGQSRTATFLMTDIAGSTRLWEEQRPAMVVALAAHDSLLRSAVEDAGGTVFKTTGDGLLAAFERPGAAVRAAVAGQRALRDHAWPTAAPLQVRMAIHSGDAEIRDDDYFGPSLNRVARLLSIGHGGQVLISAAGAAMASDDLPDGVTLLDRGEHHLKDLARPEHVYQLGAPGLPTEFPPLRSGAAPTNLPADLTSFVGRERETAEIRELLRLHRLVTLAGVGGTGKTRLMLHVADELAGRHTDGAWLVELAPMREPALVVPEVARALGIQVGPGQPAIGAVIDFLRDKDLLLLLDNCEHLIEAAAALAEDLLGTCRTLQVVATSREALGVAGEAAYAVPSLGVPDTRDTLDPEAAAASEAVRLFADRAVATLPSFTLDAESLPAVVEICRRLDGIPLALELAAARISVLSAAEIAQGLGDRFRLLTGGRRTAVPRQQTLQALIDWSWNLLGDADQRLLRRLSVFAGGWTLEAAAAVTGDQDDPAAAPASASRLDALDGLERLVDRSLVVVAHTTATRYGMLETIRQYASDRLVASGEAAGLRARHLARFHRLAVDAAVHLLGPDMVEWLGRLEAETDNLRAALDWAFEAEPKLALEMCVALAPYWRSRSLGSEGADRLMQAVDLARRWRLEPSSVPEAERTVLAARVMVGATAMVGHTGWSAAGAMATEAMELAQASGDPEAVVDGTVLELQFAIVTGSGRQVGEMREAARHAVQLATELGDPVRLSVVESIVAMMEAGEDAAAAEAWLERSTEAARSTRNPLAIAMVLQMRGRVATRAGRHADAQRWFREAQANFEAMGDRRFALSAQSELAHALRRSGADDEADAAYRLTIRGWQRTGNRGAVANQLESLAFTALAKGDASRAARLLGAAEALREACGESMMPMERLEYGAAVDRLRERLDPEALGVAWAEGRAMTVPAAVELAATG